MARVLSGATQKVYVEQAIPAIHSPPPPPTRSLCSGIQDIPKRNGSGECLV